MPNDWTLEFQSNSAPKGKAMHYVQWTQDETNIVYPRIIVSRTETGDINSKVFSFLKNEKQTWLPKGTLPLVDALNSTTFRWTNYVFRRGWTV